jgi:hypothetical protein
MQVPNAKLLYPFAPSLDDSTHKILLAASSAGSKLKDPVGCLAVIPTLPTL